MVAEAPSKPAIDATVDLKDLVSAKVRDTMRGIEGKPTEWNEAKGRRQVVQDPTPAQLLGNKFAAFKEAAAEIFGWENAVKQMGLSVEPGQADALIAQTAKELDIYDPDKYLKGTAQYPGPEANRMAQRPGIEKVRGNGFDGVIAHVAKRCPEAFEAVATPEMKEIAASRNVPPAVKEPVAEATAKQPYQVNYDIAPAGPELQAAMEFRETLTASQLRQYAENVAIVRPLDQNAQAAAQNAADFFVKSGYKMSTFQIGEDGTKIDLSKDQVTKLNSVAKDMPLVAQQRDEAVKFGLVAMLGTQGQAVEGQKGVKEATSDRMGITLKGNANDLTVTTARSGAVLFQMEKGVVTQNRISVEVSQAICSFGETFKAAQAAKASTKSSKTKDEAAIG